MANDAHSLETALLSNAQSLRALARGLLGDEHAAEDVVQDAWLNASKRPLTGPQTASGLGGWLHRMTTNLAHNRRRSDRIQTHHETRAARSEALGASDDAAAEREVVTRVIAAVSELEDPYRSVIVMRYYQDMAPRFIAEERGVPVATVKSQLHRGLALLRERLDELSNGDRGHWAALLASALRGSGAFSSARAVTAVSVTKLIAATVALVGAVWLVREIATEEPPHETPLAAGALPDEAVVGFASQEQEVEPETARAVVFADPLPLASAWAPAPHAFSLHLEVVQTRGRAVEGAEVLLAPAGAPMSFVGRTDSSGTLDVRWRGHEPRAKMVLGIREFGQLRAGLREIEVHADEPMRLRMPSRYHGLFQKVKAPSITLHADGRIERSTKGGSVMLDSLPLSAAVWTAPRNETTGDVQFVQSGSASRSKIDLSAGALDLKKLPIKKLGASPSGSRPDSDEKGRPVPKAPTIPAVERGGVVKGRLTRSGASVSGPWCVDVEFHERGSLFADVGVLDEGAFHFQNQPEGQARLIFTSAESWPFASAAHDVLSPTPVAEVELDGRSAAGGSVEVTVLGPDGACEAEVQLWQASSGRGLWLAYDKRAKVHHHGDTRPGLPRMSPRPGSRPVHRAPPGTYRLRVGTPESGYVDWGDVQVTSSETLRVMPIPLKQPARLSLRVEAEDPTAWTWSVRRRSEGLDLVCATDPDWKRGARDVPEGDYWVSLVGPDFTMPATRLSLRAGEERSLAIDPSSLGEVAIQPVGSPDADGPSRRFRVLGADGASAIHAGTFGASSGTRFHLPEGDYQLELDGSRRRFEVIAGIAVSL